MLSAKDAFKTGFLARCVENGMTPEQMLASVKRANDMLEKTGGIIGDVVGHGLDIGKGVAGSIASYGIPTAIAAPPIIGGLGGFALSKATDIDDTDVAEIKDREVKNEYMRQTAKLLRMKQVRDYQRLKQRTGRVFP